MTLIISVVICTYNRQDLLKDLLETFSKQVLNFSEFEVLIIDNNSSDDTSKISKYYTQRFSNFHYFLEKKQGLSAARNRGWKESKGIYVAYVDDDCKVPTEFLLKATKIIDTVKPNIFGGPYYAFYNTPKSNWFKDEYGSHCAFQEEKNVNDTPEILHGGNLFIQKKLLTKIGGFNPNLGMKGEKIAYGEETDFIRLVKHRKPDAVFFFHPDLFLYHLVRPEKMQWKWILRSNFSKGKYNFHVFGERLTPLKKIVKSILLFLVVIFVGLPKTLMGLFFRSRKKQPYYQQFFYEASLTYIKYIGWLYEHLFGKRMDRS